jgi:two-component system LytT family response regulator
MGIPAIVIEDESDAQQLLASILRDYCPDIQLLGIAADVESAVNLIQELQPELIFLDVNLKNECGFELLDKFLFKPFKVIITTAFEEYALKAFEYEAIDYILKPYSPLQVSKSVNRIKKIKSKEGVFKNLESLIHKSNKVLTISLPTNDGINIFKVKDIVRVEADRAYCMIFLENGVRRMISKALKEIEEILPEYFYRTHTSHLINLEKLQKFAKEDGGYALMSDGSKIPIARRRKVDFLEKIQQSGF